MYNQAMGHFEPSFVFVLSFVLIINEIYLGGRGVQTL